MLLVLALDFRLGVDDTVTSASIVYAPCDAQGNQIAGQMPQTVRLKPSEVALFESTPGSTRIKAQAALQANLGQAAAGPTT